MIPSLLPDLSTSAVLKQRQWPLVVLDANVEDYSDLAADLTARADVLVLSPERDGVEQITAALEQRDRITELHLVSHGSSGRLQIGNTQLSLETIDSYADQLQAWSHTLAGADIHVYGCQVAKGALGYLFLQQLHQLTGANLAASSQQIGR
uniref:DUF4347 domain-containing protein n=1 Tax=Acaryochloris sp. IP29b_bin.148 TaxID=2969218 RepID=UPI0026256DE2